MFQPCSAKWSPVEHACLVLSLKAWLERGSGEGTLELYVFLASKLRKKSVRDVVLRIEWLLCGWTSDDNSPNERLKGRLRQFFRSYDSHTFCSLAAIVHTGTLNMLQENEDTLIKLEEGINSGHLVANQSSLKPVSEGILTCLHLMPFAASKVSFLPRFPVKLNIPLAEQLILHSTS